MRALLSCFILTGYDFVYTFSYFYEFVWSCLIDMINGLTLLYLFYNQGKVTLRRKKVSGVNGLSALSPNLNKRPNYNTKGIIDIL
jgi:hypothetical protein